MAKKVNTTFIAGLTAIVIIAAGGLVTLIQLAKKTPQEHVTIAAALATEGDLSGALSEYGKAVHKDPRNLKASVAMLQTIRVAPATSLTQARELSNSKWALLRNLAEYHRDKPEFRQQYFETLLNDYSAAANGYANLYSAANTRIQNAPDDLIAQRYRGIAVALAPNNYPAQEIQDQTVADLAAAHAANASDGMVIYCQALFKIHQASQNLQAGLPRKDAISEAREAISMAKLASEMDPNDVKHASWLTLALAQAIQFDLNDTPEFFNAFKDSIPALVSAAEESDANPDRITEIIYAAQVCQAYLRTEGNVGIDGQQVPSRAAKAISLLKSVDSKLPDEPIILNRLATTQSTAGLKEQAVATFNRLVALQNKPLPATKFILANYFASNAIYQKTRIALSTKSQETNTSADSLKEAMDSIQHLKTNAAGNDTGQTLHLEGLVALAQKENKQAVAILDRAINASLSLDSESKRQILNDAITAAAITPGNQGLMRRWLEQALALNPNDLLKRMQLTQLNLQAAMAGTPGRDYYGLAKQQAEIFKQQDNSMAQLVGAWIDAQIHATKDKNYKAALDELSGFDYADLAPISQRSQATIADWLVKTNQTDSAVALLKKQLDANPKDIDTAVRYARLLDSDEDKQAVLQQLGEQGLSTDALETLRTLVLGSVEEQRRLQQETLAGKRTPTEASKHAIIHTAWRKQDHDEAIRLSEEAILADPKDETAWIYKVRSVFTRDGKQAAQLLLADAVSDTGTSETLWRGRLALLEQEYQRARVLIERGIESDPTNGMAYADLGDALLELGDTTAAINAYNESIDLTGVGSGRRSLFGLYEAYVALEDPQRAIESLRALAQHRHFYTAQEWLNHASAEDEFGDPQRALRLRETLATSYPKLYSLRRQLAVSYAKSDDTDKAQDAMQNLIAEEGLTLANTLALANIDQIIIGKQKGIDAGHDAGLQRLKQYIAELADAATHTDHLALAEYLARINKTPEAINAYKAAIAAEPLDTLPATRRLTQRYISAGAYEQAAPLLEKLATSFPTDSGIQASSVDVFTRLGRFEDARAIATKLDPSTAAVPITLAQQHLSKQSFDEAITTLNEALKNTSSFTDTATATLLRLRVNARNAKQASVRTENTEATQANLLDLNQALAKNPNNGLLKSMLADTLRQAGDLAGAIRELEPLVNQTQNSQYRRQLVQALVADGDLREAIQQASRGLDLEPSSLAWMRTLAQLYSARANHNEAARYWAQIVAQNDSNEVVSSDIANASQAYLNAGQFQNILTLVDQHPAVYSESPELLALRGQALARTNKLEAAKQVFNNAIARTQDIATYLRVTSRISSALGLGSESGNTLILTNESHSETWRAWAAARSYLSSGNHKAVIETLQKVWPPTDDAGAIGLGISQSLGVAHQQLGNHLEAKMAYEAALGFDPNNPETLNNFAYLLTANLNDAESALPLAQKASESTNSSIPAIQDTLGWVYYKLGKLEEAEAVLKGVTEMAPDLAVSHYHLGQVYAGIDGPENTSRAELAQQRALSAARRSKDDATRALAETELNQLRENNTP